MRPATHPTALRLQEQIGDEYAILEFEESTRTSADAAAAIGCTVAQIAKSMVFRAESSDRVVLVVTSGTNRVDDKKVSTLIEEKAGKADADFVRRRTGYAIGGVAPAGHTELPIILLDEDLAQFDELWAAGGTPNTVFKLTPAQLKMLTGSDFADVKK